MTRVQPPLLSTILEGRGWREGEEDFASKLSVLHVIYKDVEVSCEKYACCILNYGAYRLMPWNLPAALA